MTKPFIVVGDKTDHGGTVTAGAPTTTTGGKPIARIGDPVPCPRCGSHQKIVSGQLDIIIDGQPVAVDGDKTSCGAILISSQLATSKKTGGSGQAAARNTVAETAAPTGADLAWSSRVQHFDELPPKAQAYVFNRAYDQHVLGQDEALTDVAPNNYTETTGASGIPELITRDQTTYERLIRSRLGLRPFERLDASRILNSAPGDPTMQGINPNHETALKPVATIKRYDSDSAQLARFMDGRPTEGVGGLSDTDEGSPRACRQEIARRIAPPVVSGKARVAACGMPRARFATRHGAAGGDNPKGQRPSGGNPALSLAYVTGPRDARDALSCHRLAAGATGYLLTTRPKLRPRFSRETATASGLSGLSGVLQKANNRPFRSAPKSQ